MKKISDRILLGIVSGIISGIPGRVLNRYEYHKGSTDIKYGQIAASFFLPKSKVNTKEGKLIGYIVNHINLGITGVIITYLLSATGRDKAILKGAGVTAAAWLFVYGVASRLSINVRGRKKLAPILSFLDHLSLGTLCGLLVSKLGDDALFPDTVQCKNHEKLPLFATNTKESQCERFPETVLR